ncbi:MAG: retropepsin-like domain-containing protein [Cyclobacteriaceae bacterium]|nr:retropepsin-like domain-containing protein [Cyclobacteriaceae bacterium]
MERSRVRVFFFCVLPVVSGCISINYFDRGELIAMPNTITEIPFRSENGLIVIGAEINGVHGQFLFDNGFSLSAVTPQFAERAGIRFKNKMKLTDANNNAVSTPVAIVDTVRFGHLSFVNTGFYEVDTDVFFPCTAIDGIIGGSIINKANWEIDFRQSKIRISPDPFDNKGIRMDISFSGNNNTFTTLLINGNHPVNSKIDFGKNSPLSLRYEDVISFMSNTPVKKMEGIRAVSSHGIGAPEVFYHTAQPVSIQHKNETLPSAEVTLSSTLKYSGYIGAAYFRNFLVAINSSEQAYVLSAIDTVEDGDKGLSYGIAIHYHNGKWRVIQKNAADSLLSSISILDEVEEIDQKPISSFADICAYRQYVNEKKWKNEPLVLKISGMSKHLVLPYRTPVNVTLLIE